LDVQTLPGSAVNLALQHAVHVAHGRSQDVDPRGLDEMSPIVRGRQAAGEVGSPGMDFRAGSYVTYLSFYQDGGVDAFEHFDGLPGLAHVLLKGQCRKGTVQRLPCAAGRWEGTGRLPGERALAVVDCRRPEASP